MPEYRCEQYDDGVSVRRAIANDRREALTRVLWRFDCGSVAASRSLRSVSAYQDDNALEPFSLVWHASEQRYLYSQRVVLRSGHLRRFQRRLKGRTLCVRGLLAVEEW